MKKQRGITLIALVITIIVLLILAGITINLTIGERGIITKAQEAGKNHINAQDEELAYLDELTQEMNNTINGIYYAEDTLGNKIPVPKGFSPITEGQGTKETGFVIKNDIDGNEFVWIPVEGMGYSYNRYALFPAQPLDVLDEATQSMKIKHTLNGPYYYTETMPADEKLSVETYGGYYLGRYETGIIGYDPKVSTTSDGSAIWTGYTGGRLAIQKGKQVWNYITKDRAKIEAEKLYNKTNDNVISKLCSSYAWDTALKFIEKNNSAYITNSTEGNYSDTTFTYKDLAGKVQTKEQGATKLVPTGQTTPVNNIYDMGGNVWEWTTENMNHEDDMHVGRGGRYVNKSTTAASGRGYNSGGFSDFGFRVVLFI